METTNATTATTTNAKPVRVNVTASDLRAYVTQGHAPRKLLVNHAYVAAVEYDLARNNRPESIIYALVSTGRGGAEYRPLARFDTLPENPRYFVRRPGTEKPIFDEIGLHRHQ